MSSLNIIKYIILCSILFLFSCSDLKPLYDYENDSKIRKTISNINILPIEGRYGTTLRNVLVETFGTKKHAEEKNRFTMVSTVSHGSASAQAFESDGTASRFNSVVGVSYTVYDKNKCVIFNGSNSTNASFNSKSGGYDFGNIASERFAIRRNIEYNVKNFYPHIYNAIKNKKEDLPFIPPYLSIRNFKGCRS